MPEANSNEQRTASLIIHGGLLLFGFSLIYPVMAYPALSLLTFSGLALLFLIGTFSVTDISRKRIYLLTFPAVWIIYHLFAYVNAPVTAFSRDPLYILIFGQMFFLLFLLPMFLGEKFAQSHRHILYTRALLILIVFVTLESLFGIYQVFGPASMPGTFAEMEKTLLSSTDIDVRLKEGLLHAARESRATATLGAPNIFATFCAAAIPLILGFLASSKKLNQRLALSGSLLCIIFALFLSGSNGGILAGAFGFSAFFLFFVFKYISRKQAWGILAAAALIFGVALIALVFAAKSTEGTGTRWLNSSGVEQRFLYWQTASKVFLQSPVTGEGLGAYEVEYTLFRSPGANETKHPHSWLFRYLAELGIIGLALFLLFIGCIVYTAFKKTVELSKGDSKDSFFSFCGLLAAVLALLFHGLIEYTFGFAESFMLFWILTGILGASILGNTVYQKQDLLPARPVFLVYLLLFVLITNFLGGIPSIRAKTQLEKIEGMAYSRAPLEEILEESELFVESDPSNPKAYENRGYYRQVARWEGALEDFQKAAELNPYSALYSERISRYHENQGDIDAAIAAQIEATQKHPLDLGHQLRLVQLYLASGEKENAVKALEQAASLKATSTEERELQTFLERQLIGTDQQ